MHFLLAHCGGTSDQVVESDRSIVFDRDEARLHPQKPLRNWLLEYRCFRLRGRERTVSLANAVCRSEVEGESCGRLYKSIVLYLRHGSMKALQKIASDDTWRYAILVGLASTPFSVLIYWQSSNGYSYGFEPVFVAGLLVGFLASGRELDERRVGSRTGLVALFPALWPFVDTLVFISDLTQSLWFSGVQVTFLVVFYVFAAGLSMLVGMVGALIGNWLLTTVRNDTVALAKAGTLFVFIVVVLASFRLLVGDPPGRKTSLEHTLSVAVWWGGVCAVLYYVFRK
ncbi:hypothetical protein SAMN05443661_11416 [Natronobacterium gregoryi]|nr:hypothetical protein Natgr_1618 [Natronobacterium gregoryi SP2]SFJ09921.1 hypothetical protein SAMN05443661_11416 [Natronobacterium gregoryi]